MTENGNSNGGAEQECGYTYVQGMGFVPYSPLQVERRTLLLHANMIGIAVLIYFFMQGAVTRYIVHFMRLFLPDIRYFNSHLMAPDWVVGVISSLSLIICVCLPCGLYLLTIKMPIRVALPLRRPAKGLLVPAVFISLAVSVIGSLISRFLGGLLWGLGLIPITPDLPISRTVVGVVFAVLNYSVLSAFAWWFSFNGAVLQSLRRFGDGFAILSTAVILSVMSPYVTYLPVTFLVGLVSGYFVIRTGSLWTGIIIQFCSNTFSLLMGAAMYRATEKGGELLIFISAIIVIIVGLIFIITLVSSSDNLFYMKSPKLHISARRRIGLFFSSPGMLAAFAVSGYIMLRGLQRLPR